jgi:hypothetical protein
MDSQNARRWKSCKSKMIVSVAVVLSLLSAASHGWAVPLPCLPWANNTDTYNPVTSGKQHANKFWYASSAGFNFSRVDIWTDGTYTFTIPGGSGFIGQTSKQPALQYFDDRMVVLIIGQDNKIYATTWTGSIWQGWAAYPMPTNFTQHSPSLAASAPLSPTVQNPGALVAVAKTLDGYVWAAVSLHIVNGFSVYPNGWLAVGGPTQTVLGNTACGDPFELRIGGQGGDGICYRRKSTNYGGWWNGDEVLDPCP